MKNIDSVNNKIHADYTIIMIDNFDSFTYNLVNQLQTFVKQVKVYRNDVSVEKINKACIDACKENAQKVIIVLSPGPGSPKTAGNLLDILKSLKGKYPILGVCLGHQAIVESYGGMIGHAKNVVHGKSHLLEINLAGKKLFRGITPFSAARYHSLAAIKMPAKLEILAHCDNEVMLVREQKDKVYGLQFHPESILTPNGSELIKRILTKLIG